MVSFKNHKYIFFINLVLEKLILEKMNKPHHTVQNILKDMSSMLALSVLFFLMLHSCKDENLGVPVKAGVAEGLNHYVIDPPLVIKLMEDSVNNIQYGTDSIDINQDGYFDFFIWQRTVLNEDLPIGSMLLYPYALVLLRNGLGIAIRKETYYIGLGQTSQIDWVDTLAVNSRIDLISGWSDDNAEVYMWMMPPTIFWGSNGCWFNLFDEVRYIGIRMKGKNDYKYGWIKLRQRSSGNFEIQEYAMEKPGE